MTIHKFPDASGSSTADFPTSTRLTNAQTGTTYTPVLSDKDKLIELSNAASITVTIPPNSTTPFPIGTQIDWLWTGVGQPTFVGNVSPAVTVNATPGLKLRAQWSAATLVKRATDTWVLIGDLTA